MAETQGTQQIWLVSNDNVTQVVGAYRAPSLSLELLADKTIDRAVAERSMLIKNMLDDLGDENVRQDNPIPIPNVCIAPSLVFDCR